MKKKPVDFLRGWRSNRLGASVIALLLLMSGSASADGLPGECTALGADIEAETGAKLDRVTSAAIIWRPNLPKFGYFDNEMSLVCTGDERIYWSLHLSWSQGAAPPNAFYNLVGKAGSMFSGDRPKDLIVAAQSCIEAGLNSSDEWGKAKTSRATLECQAFTRDGGRAGVSIQLRELDPPQ